MEKPRLKVQILDQGKVAEELSFAEFPIVFGRGSQCHLRFEQMGFVSRVHGSIAVIGKEIVVTDLGSSNGLVFEGKVTRAIRKTESVDFKIQSLNLRLSLEGEESDEDEITEINVYRPATRKAPRPGDPVRDKNDLVNFSVTPIADLDRATRADIIVQAVVTWHEEIYDVQNFLPGDSLTIGTKQTDAVYLPTATRQTNYGLFTERGVILNLPKLGFWTIYRNRLAMDLEDLATEKKIVDGGSDYKVSLGLNEVASVDMGSNMAIHFRFVRRPQFRISRTLLENREEFQKAMVSSGLIHFFFIFLTFLAIPKEEVQKIENVSPRIAKLILEPPPQILAAPTPPPPVATPVPTATPPPPAVAQTPVPTPIPKPVPKPVEKRIADKKPPTKKPETLKPVAKTERKPEPATKEPPSKEPPSTEPQISPEEKQAAKEQAELSKMLSSLPAPPSAGSKNAGAPIQISKDRVSPQGMKVGGVVAAAGASVKSNLPNGSSETGFKAGTGYSAKSPGGIAGKRKVEGAVVGTPKLTPKVGREQGLTDDVVMKEVNKHLAQIQRCYERALFDDAELAGRVEYEWEISPAGSVTSARVQRSEVGRGDSLNNCVLALFRKMKFPKAPNGQSTVAKIGFPFGRN